MSEKIEMIGKKFGRLTVLEEVGKNKQGKILYKCLCECGGIVVTKGANLASGNTSSCGCYQRDRVSETNREDVTGKQFGKLTAIKYLYSDKEGHAVWLFSCACGGTIEAKLRYVKEGDLKSCGCIENKFESPIARELKKFCIKEHGAIQEFDDCINPSTKMYLPYDIFIPLYSTAVEVNGSQHYVFTPMFHNDYEDFLYQEKRDKIKREWAESHYDTFIVIDLREVLSLEDAINLVEWEVVETECSRLCL